MKSKIFVVLLVVLLAGGSFLFGSNEKPFKGYVEQVGPGDYSIDPLDYPFLAEIIAQYGPPSYVVPPVLNTYEGNNNVGGKSLSESAQIFYFHPLPDFSRFILFFYEDITITVANGDKIFARVTGVYYSSIDKIIDKGIITGGTGRFEGAEGEFTGTYEGFEGYIKY